MPRGVLEISADREVQRIVFGLKFLISRFLGGKKILARIFLDGLKE